MRVGVRNVERRVGDLAHAGESLDVERVVWREGPEGESLCYKSRLVLHEKEIKEDYRLAAMTWSAGLRARATAYYIFRLRDDSSDHRHHDHRRRSDGAVRLFLCRNARRYRTDRRRSARARRAAHCAVSGEVHLRRRWIREDP